MLKDDLENIKKEFEKKRKEKAEQELQERVKKVSEKYSKIIEDLIVELTDAANKGYNSCCLIGPENFYMPDEDELRCWARSEKINLNFKHDRPFITDYDDRSKIKVVEIFESFLKSFRKPLTKNLNSAILKEQRKANYEIHTKQN